MRNEKGDLNWWVWFVNLVIFIIVQSVLRGAFVGHLLHEMDSVTRDGGQILWGVFVFATVPIMLSRHLTPYRAAARAVGAALLYMMLAPVAIAYGLEQAARLSLDMSGAVLYAAMMATAAAGISAAAVGEFVDIIGDGMNTEMSRQEAARARAALQRAEREAASV